jgi:hypothetical protein
LFSVQIIAIINQDRPINVPLVCNGSLAIFTKDAPLRVRGPSTTSAAADHSKPKAKAAGAMTMVLVED